VDPGSSVQSGAGIRGSAGRSQASIASKPTALPSSRTGPLKKARHLESLGYFNIQLGYVLGNGPDIGFKLAR
jgi:hypothetical protein